MAEISIWQGSAVFTTGKTAFGFYDSDEEFATDAPMVAKWCAQRLGYPLVDIELQDINFFTAFEEAISEYGAQVYQFQIINNLGRIKGFSTASHEDGLNQIYLDDVYGSSEGGGASVGAGQSGGGGGSYGEKTFSASLDVKQGIQRYDLLSNTPAFASTTIEFGASEGTFGKIRHSSSIEITDTNGVTVVYRATTGSSAGGYNNSMGADDPRQPKAGNMTTGSGEYRRYQHISASVGEFVTGSYGGFSTFPFSNPNGLNDIEGSAANTTLSASFDSFISTLTHPSGRHAKSFNVSSSYNADKTIFYVKLTQKVEGTGGNSKITLTNMTGVTASGVTSTTSTVVDGFDLPGEITSSFSGGSSGLSFETSGSQIQAKSKKVVVKKIYHYQPAAINRYFDPYAGTGTGIQSLMQTFGFGNYSPGVNFMLMPMYFDALKLQAIEFNDQIRKSAYHFEINADRYLRLFPIPTSDYTLWFDYTVANSSTDLTIDQTAEEGEDDEKDRGTITDMSNAPYKRPTYSFINEPGRQWIRKYALALCKEMLGGIRGKYQSVPIPGSETTLDYSRLLSEASAEKDSLIVQLREDLEATTTLNQSERLAAESSATQTQYSLDNPYQIYIH